MMPPSMISSPISSAAHHIEILVIQTAGVFRIAILVGKIDLYGVIGVLFRQIGVTVFGEEPGFRSVAVVQFRMFRIW